MTRRRTGALIAAAAAAIVAVLVVSFNFNPFMAWSAEPGVAARTGPTARVVAQPPPYATTSYGSSLALTPPMGWNGYNHFGLHVTADIVMAMARALVTTRLKDAGYEYVNLDGGWDLPQRSLTGELQPNPKLFPNGIQPVIAYVHSLGLKFGIYTSAGLMNCRMTSAGSYGHYEQDAETFADWGVDYVKLDWCLLPRHLYQKLTLPQLGLLLATRMSAALRTTGRPIVLDLNDFNDDRPWSWARDLGNMIRSAPDIEDNFHSMVFNFYRAMTHYQLAGPDHWNDPDMLEVGNGGMTTTEYRTMFSLWAEEAAPLIAGNDLTRMSADTLAILGNRLVIGVDQDPLGSQGYAVTNSNGHWVLTRPLSGNRRAVVLFNQTTRPAQISTTAAAVGVTGAAAYELLDLWTQDTTITNGAISATVPPHAVVMYVVSAQG